MTTSIFRQLARELGPALRDFIRGRLDTQRVRGLHLDVDRYWLAWLHRHVHPYWDDVFFRELEWQSGDDLLKLRPPGWEEHCFNSGYYKEASPILVRIIFRSPKDLRARGDLPSHYQNYPIVYESRPPAVGIGDDDSTMCHGGDSIGRRGPDTAGTLGGFLRAINSGTDYLVSCAHVLGGYGEDVYTPGPADTKSGFLKRIRSWVWRTRVAQIARVRYAQLPQPNKEEGCNNETHPNQNSIDVALAEPHSSAQIQASYGEIAKPQALTPSRAMKSGARLLFVAKNHRRVDCEGGSYCIYHELNIQNQTRCFGDIFTVTWPTPWYFNTTIAKPGDSGSWVLRLAGRLVSWDGMIVACDGATAYACYADNILAGARSVIPDIALAA